MGEIRFWRMFMSGEKGDMFKACRNRGIAALGYLENGKSSVGDCSGFSTLQEFYLQFDQKFPRARKGAKGNFEYLRFGMKREHIIYVVKNNWIVGKGVITKEYEYDENILHGAPEEWPHFVTVDWEEYPTGFPIKLTGRLPIFELQGKDLKQVLDDEAMAKLRRKMK